MEEEGCCERASTVGSGHSLIGSALLKARNPGISVLMKYMTCLATGLAPGGQVTSELRLWRGVPDRNVESRQLLVLKPGLACWQAPGRV